MMFITLEGEDHDIAAGDFVRIITYPQHETRKHIDYEITETGIGLIARPACRKGTAIIDAGKP